MLFNYSQKKIVPLWDSLTVKNVDFLLFVVNVMTYEMDCQLCQKGKI